MIKYKKILKFIYIVLIIINLFLFLTSSFFRIDDFRTSFVICFVVLPCLFTEINVLFVKMPQSVKENGNFEKMVIAVSFLIDLILFVVNIKENEVSANFIFLNGFLSCYLFYLNYIKQ